MEDNGRTAAPAAETLVRFGPGPAQVISLEWAERALTWIHQNRNPVFGAAMLHVMACQPETAARGRRPGTGDGQPRP